MSAFFLALAAVAQAPAQAPDYSAHGSEPFWGLEIRGRRIVFMPNDGSESDSGISATLPRRQPTRTGYRLVTPRFTVFVSNRACEDEGERRYRDTVRVQIRGRSYLGCGGTLLPPVAVTNTDWLITAINGARVDGDNYALQFGEGRLTGQAGCNRMSGPFRQRGASLTAGPIISTRMACPGPRMAHERALAQLLRGPVRIAFPAGDVLVLSGSGVTVRLRRN